MNDGVGATVWRALRHQLDLSQCRAAASSCRVAFMRIFLLAYVKNCCLRARCLFDFMLGDATSKNCGTCLSKGRKTDEACSDRRLRRPGSDRGSAGCQRTGQYQPEPIPGKCGRAVRRDGKCTL